MSVILNSFQNSQKLKATLGLNRTLFEIQKKKKVQNFVSI